jgi:hypothetical protein
MRAFSFVLTSEVDHVESVLLGPSEAREAVPDDALVELSLCGGPGGGGGQFADWVEFEGVEPDHELLDDFRAAASSLRTFSRAVKPLAF